jgi:quercetin dioxygenase-like cupin family protein
MSKRGDVFNNPVTGEFGAIRLGTEDTPDKRVVSDIRVRPGDVVISEHVHPSIKERFTVVSGKIGYRLDGKEGIATGGDVLEIERGMVHDWWNAGDEEARVIVEIIPADRFELMISTLFGLVADGKTDKNGVPNLLQTAVIAQEFSDIVQFMSPPPMVQNILFRILAPLGRRMGYQAIYEQYVNSDVETVELDPLPEHLQYLDKV